MASGPNESAKASIGLDALSTSEKGPTSMKASSTPRPANQTRQSRVRLREDAIVSAAREMFIAYGYSGTTMAMIARAAGVADGTLYTYFENKDALARAVISDFYARLSDRARAGVAGRRRVRRKLEGLARNHLDLLIADRRVVEMLPLLTSSLSEYTGSDHHRMNREYVAIFDSIINEGQASGEIAASLDVRVLRDIFFGALDFGATSLLINSGKGNASRLVEQLVNMIVGAEGSSPSVADRLDAVATRLEAALGKGQTP